MVMISSDFYGEAFKGIANSSHVSMQFVLDPIIDERNSMLVAKNNMQVDLC
jgi:hypothetical protein